MALWSPVPSLVLLLLCHLSCTAALKRVYVARRPDRVARFVVGEDRERFTPRGANYIRLHGYHSTFSPLFYAGNRSAHEAALRAMGEAGYNVVRVFIDNGGWIRSDGVAGDLRSEASLLDRAYMNNVADFVGLAAFHNVWVMITFDFFPQSKHFHSIAQQGVNTTEIAGINSYYLQRGYVLAMCDFVRAFVNMLGEIGGHEALPNVFAYSLANEQTLVNNFPPFTKSSSHLQQLVTADGASYNMSDQSDRQACADSNTLYWAKQVARAIRSVDPQALVTVGMFAFWAVGKKTGANGLLNVTGADNRFPARPTILSRHSTLDFLDFHMYPLSSKTAEWNLSSVLLAEEWNDVDVLRTPILMGEFGAWRHIFGTPVAAADYLTNYFQPTSCKYNFAGWLYWTYDTHEQPQLLSMVDGDNIIARALSPLFRPDACSEAEPQQYFATSTAESTCASEGGTPANRATCFRACDSGVGGATMHGRGSWQGSPGCFVVVSGTWQGNCHWNVNTSASAYAANTRAVCIQNSVISDVSDVSVGHRPKLGSPALPKAVLCGLALLVVLATAAVTAAVMWRARANFTCLLGRRYPSLAHTDHGYLWIRSSSTNPRHY